MTPRRKRAVFILTPLLLVWAGVWIRGVVRPLPQGTSVEGDLHRLSSVRFLSDLTFQRDGGSVSEQAIFQAVFDLIDAADRFIVIDMFLFNDEHGGDRDYVPLTEQLTTRLIAKTHEAPGIQITFITDEINNFYGAYTSPPLAELEEHGIDVIVTDLTKLRDSNPTYSSIWRTYLRWFGTGGRGFLPHPLSSTGRRVTARSYLKLLNFRANHRKLIVTEDGCLVSSANPHDASSFHSNIAFAMRGTICRDVLNAERAVAEFSGGSIPAHAFDGFTAPEPVTMRLVTEGKIETAVRKAIDAATPAGGIDMAMFYLSNRRIVGALRRAAERGVPVRLVLDPNKDAFGREKGGVPNRQVAWELHERSDGRVRIRWYDTRGEQFHTKLVVVRGPDFTTILGGSANMTRRNIRDYNLEANVQITASSDARVARDVRAYFDRIWSDDDGQYTLAYEAFEDGSWLKRVLYRFQEFSGWSSF